jgi:hypothetical protein
MRTTRPMAALVIAATAALTACGGANAAAGQPANHRVCQHYQTQRTTVKNLAEPTLADAIQFETWVALDAQQAIPGTPLARDLAAMSRAQQDTGSPASAVYDASIRVLHDCTALGVTFQP